MKLKRAGIITKIIVLALIVYAGISLVTLRAQVTEIRAEKADLEAQVAEMTQTNAELQYELAHSEDADTIEDIARNKLGLVMPGEKIFYDISN